MNFFEIDWLTYFVVVLVVSKHVLGSKEEDQIATMFDWVRSHRYVVAGNAQKICVTIEEDFLLINEYPRSREEKTNLARLTLSNDEK